MNNWTRPTPNRKPKYSSRTGDGGYDFGSMIYPHAEPTHRAHRWHSSPFSIVVTESVRNATQCRREGETEAARCLPEVKLVRWQVYYNYYNYTTQHGDNRWNFVSSDVNSVRVFIPTVMCYCFMSDINKIGSISFATVSLTLHGGRLHRIWMVASDDRLCKYATQGTFRYWLCHCTIQPRKIRKHSNSCTAVHITRDTDKRSKLTSARMCEPFRQRHNVRLWQKRSSSVRTTRLDCCRRRAQWCRSVIFVGMRSITFGCRRSPPAGSTVRPPGSVRRRCGAGDALLQRLTEARSHRRRRRSMARMRRRCCDEDEQQTNDKHCSICSRQVAARDRTDVDFVTVVEDKKPLSLAGDAKADSNDRRTDDRRVKMTSFKWITLNYNCLHRRWRFNWFVELKQDESVPLSRFPSYLALHLILYDCFKHRCGVFSNSRS